MHSINITIERNIAIVRVSNPPAGYLNEHFVTDLDRAIRQVGRNDEVRVIIITGGQEGVFIQHYDLREVEAVSRKLNGRKSEYGEGRHVPERGVDLLLRRLESLGKPVIAAINGNAMGGGLELSLACDFRLVQGGDYLLGLPEIRIGALPGAGGTQRLARLVGPGVALDLVLHGRRFSPHDALAFGLVHEVTTEPVLARAIERASDLAQLPPKALGYVKRLIREAADRTLYQGLDLERTLFMDLLSSPESLELVEVLNRRGGDFSTV